MTDDIRRIKVATPPVVGTIFELNEPYTFTRWVVVGVQVDPDAVWTARYDNDGDPELLPGSYLLNLRPVK